MLFFEFNFYIWLLFREIFIYVFLSKEEWKQKSTFCGNHSLSYATFFGGTIQELQISMRKCNVLIKFLYFFTKPLRVTTLKNWFSKTILMSGRLIGFGEKITILINRIRMLFWSPKFDKWSLVCAFLRLLLVLFQCHWIMRKKCLFEIYSYHGAFFLLRNDPLRSQSGLIWLSMIKKCKRFMYIEINGIWISLCLIII